MPVCRKHYPRSRGIRRGRGVGFLFPIWMNIDSKDVCHIDRSSSEILRSTLLSTHNILRIEESYPTRIPIIVSQGNPHQLAASVWSPVLTRNCMSHPKDRLKWPSQASRSHNYTIQHVCHPCDIVSRILWASTRLQDSVIHSPGGNLYYTSSQVSQDKIKTIRNNNLQQNNLVKSVKIK